MTKAGLRNSDGCTFMPRMTSQRRAPLMSAPNSGVAATNIRLATKTISDSRRIWCGVRNDTSSSTATVGTR